jgi:hypothetical protein
MTSYTIVTASNFFIASPAKQVIDAGGTIRYLPEEDGQLQWGYQWVDAGGGTERSIVGYAPKGLPIVVSGGYVHIPYGSGGSWPRDVRPKEAAARNELACEATRENKEEIGQKTDPGGGSGGEGKVSTDPTGPAGGTTTTKP